ncbi:hypothetical protein LCGC14_0351560 [marine sediment metagenome]|uniref:YqaJ viral recombinase domain-containing protein n=1 Tax=marine sediment metagenome TaxID=412755 RepID=A0A0F9TTP3_9ZZZZ
MKVISDELFKAKILDQIKTRDFGDRTGLHFSDLNYCLRKAYFRKKYPDIGGNLSEQTILKFSIGLALEKWITGDYEQKEVEVDGILLTPDFVNPKDEDDLLEIKSTMLSSNKDIKEQTAWIRQMQAYCKAYNVFTYRLAVIHLMGNWSPVWTCEKPIFKMWRFDFTKEEIEDNWLDALDKKVTLKDAFKEGVMPEAIRESWECSSNYCAWNLAGICDPNSR